MWIDVFDDKLSIFHFVLGILAYFYPVFFIVFLFYELIEHLYIGRRDHFFGDLTELIYGFAFTRLLILFIYI